MADTAGMRVLQLLGPSAGGIRRHVGVLAERLSVRGWHVEVAGPREVMDGIAVQHHVVSVPEAISLADAWRARGELRKLVGGFDLVHAHGLKAGWVAASLRKRIPLVVTIHNVVLEEAAGRQTPFLRLLERALPARVDAVIAVSAEIARRFTGAPGGSRVVVVPPVGPRVMPSRGRAEVRAELGVGSHEQLVVSATARLHPQKDLPSLLRAFAIVRQTHPATRLAIVGDGPQRQELEAMTESLDLGEVVQFTGWVANIADLMCAADVVAMSSLWEGAPITLAQAMQLGRPVVATAVGAIPEVVIDGTTGRLVPPRDPSRLAAALADLLEDPTGSAELAESGRQRVERLLDADALVSRVEDVYRATVIP